MGKVLTQLSSACACLALLVTTLNTNHFCMLFAYQPELPEGAKKLRKF